MKKEAQFHIVRAEKAGVFIGKIISKNGSTYEMSNLRRLFYWRGALEVITIAKEGVSDLSNCKFSAQLGDADISTILNVIETHPVSEKALEIINSVKPWKK